MSYSNNDYGLIFEYCSCIILFQSASTCSLLRVCAISTVRSTCRIRVNQGYLTYETVMLKKCTLRSALLLSIRPVSNSIDSISEIETERYQIYDHNQSDKILKDLLDAMTGTFVKIVRFTNLNLIVFYCLKPDDLINRIHYFL